MALILRAFSIQESLDFSMSDSTRKVREILVLPHTHHDVGYTDTPSESEMLHLEALSTGINLSLEDAKPGHAQMKWTVEVSRPLLRLLDSDPRAIERVLKANQKGRLAITGGYLNMTQLVGHGGYDRMLSHINRFRSLGLVVNAVQHGDINGLSWGLVSSMARHGIPNLLMALNPDHGRAPVTQPSVFWWKGSDTSKVLVILHAHYITATEWGMLDGNHPDETEVFEYLEALEARADYKFPFAVVHAAFDNRAPSKALAHSVDLWNQSHPDLPMSIVTVDDAIAKYRQHPLDGLAEYSGEWADWWAHGHGSSATEVSIAREAARLARSSQTVIGLANAEGLRLPRPEERGQWYAQPFAAHSHEQIASIADSVYEQLCLFEEHTWGAAEAVRSPYSRFSRVHWHSKAGFAYKAYEHSHVLSSQALGRVADASGPPPLYSTGRPAKEILLVNPSPHPQEEILPVAFDGSELEVHAKLAPYEVKMTDALSSSDYSIVEHKGPCTLDLGQFTVRFDPERGGITSILDRGVELVDQNSSNPFAAIVDEVVQEGSTHPALDNRRNFHPSTPGPEFDYFTAKGSPDIKQRIGSGWTDVTYQVALGDTLTAQVRFSVVGSHIQLAVTVDKRERYEIESVFVSFPFAIAHPRFLVETADAVFQAFDEQLPDTCRDWYSIQNAIGLQGNDRGILWGTLDAPLVQLSGFHTGTWSRDRKAEKSHINSWLYNNLYFTNFRAAQSGRDVFRFTFESTSAVDKSNVYDFGRRLSTPIIARALASNLRVHEMAHLMVQEPEVEVSNPVPTADGETQIRLNTTRLSKPVVHVSWSRGSVQISDGNVQAVLRAGEWNRLDTNNQGEITLTLRAEERKGNE